MESLRQAVSAELHKEIPAVSEQKDTGRGKTSDISEVSEIGGTSKAYRIARDLDNTKSIHSRSQWTVSGTLPAYRQYTISTQAAISSRQK